MSSSITPEDILRTNIPFMEAGNYEAITRELNKHGFSMPIYEIKQWYITEVLKKTITDEYWEDNRKFNGGYHPKKEVLDEKAED
jgi:hypothetical protein